MPRQPKRNAAADPDKPACDVELLSREWKQAPAVRLVAVEADRLLVSPDGKGESIKICIKHAVHNKFALIPVLERMAKHPSHPIPYIKPLAKESPSLIYMDLSFFYFTFPFFISCMQYLNCIHYSLN